MQVSPVLLSIIQIYKLSTFIDVLSFSLLQIFQRKVSKMLIFSPVNKT